MHGTPRGGLRARRWLGILAVLVAGLSVVSAASGRQMDLAAGTKVKPKFSHAAAFDTSKPLRTLAKTATWATTGQLPPELGPVATDTSYTGDGAVQGAPSRMGALLS